MADREEQRSDNPSFSRLLELLHGSYLRKGVRSSVASKLEQVDNKRAIFHVVIYLYEL